MFATDESEDESREPSVVNPVDDDTLFQDLDGEDYAEIEEVFQRNSVERLYCFALSL